MGAPITIVIDHETVNFTQDGKIDVLDAITSLSGLENEHRVWERLLSQRPELEALCEQYVFSPQKIALVTDVEGWETISSALFDFLVEID